MALERLKDLVERNNTPLHHPKQRAIDCDRTQAVTEPPESGSEDLIAVENFAVSGADDESQMRERIMRLIHCIARAVVEDLRESSAGGHADSSSAAGSPARQSGAGLSKTRPGH